MLHDLQQSVFVIAASFLSFDFRFDPVRGKF